MSSLCSWALPSSAVVGQKAPQYKYETDLMCLPSFPNHSLALQENSYFIFFFLFSQTERKPSTSSSVKYGGRNLTLDFNSLCVLLLLYIFACLPPFGEGNFISLEEGDFVLLVVSAIVHEMSPIIILLIYFKERLTIVSAVLFACIYRKWNPLGIKCVFQFMFLKRLWIIFLIISFQI